MNWQDVAFIFTSKESVALVVRPGISTYNLTPSKVAALKGTLQKPQPAYAMFIDNLANFQSFLSGVNADVRLRSLKFPVWWTFSSELEPTSPHTDAQRQS